MDVSATKDENERIKCLDTGVIDQDVVVWCVLWNVAHSFAVDVLGKRHRQL